MCGLFPPGMCDKLNHPSPSVLSTGGEKRQSKSKKSEPEAPSDRRPISKRHSATETQPGKCDKLSPSPIVPSAGGVERQSKSGKMSKYERQRKNATNAKEICTSTNFKSNHIVGTIPTPTPCSKDTQYCYTCLAIIHKYLYGAFSAKHKEEMISVAGLCLLKCRACGSARCQREDAPVVLDCPDCEECGSLTSITGTHTQCYGYTVSNVRPNTLRKTKVVDGVELCSGIVPDDTLYVYNSSTSYTQRDQRERVIHQGFMLNSEGTEWERVQAWTGLTKAKELYGILEESGQRIRGKVLTGLTANDSHQSDRVLEKLFDKNCVVKTTSGVEAFKNHGFLTFLAYHLSERNLPWTATNVHMLYEEFMEQEQQRYSENSKICAAREKNLANKPILEQLRLSNFICSLFTRMQCLVGSNICCAYRHYFCNVESKYCQCRKAEIDEISDISDNFFALILESDQIRETTTEGYCDTVLAPWSRMCRNLNLSCFRDVTTNQAGSKFSERVEEDAKTFKSLNELVAHFIDPTDPDAEVQKPVMVARNEIMQKFQELITTQDTLYFKLESMRLREEPSFLSAVLKNLVVEEAVEEVVVVETEEPVEEVFQEVKSKKSFKIPKVKKEKKKSVEPVKCVEEPVESRETALNIIFRDPAYESMTIFEKCQHAIAAVTSNSADIGSEETWEVSIKQQTQIVSIAHHGVSLCQEVIHEKVEETDTLYNTLGIKLGVDLEDLQLTEEQTNAIAATRSNLHSSELELRQLRELVDCEEMKLNLLFKTTDVTEVVGVQSRIFDEIQVNKQEFSRFVNRPILKQLIVYDKKVQEEAKKSEKAKRKIKGKGPKVSKGSLKVIKSEDVEENKSVQVANVVNDERNDRVMEDLIVELFNWLGYRDFESLMKAGKSGDIRFSQLVSTYRYLEGRKRMLENEPEIIPRKRADNTSMRCFQPRETTSNKIVESNPFAMFDAGEEIDFKIDKDMVAKMSPEDGKSYVRMTKEAEREAIQMAKEKHIEANKKKFESKIIIEKVVCTDIVRLEDGSVVCSGEDGIRYEISNEPEHWYMVDSGNTQKKGGVRVGGLRLTAIQEIRSEILTKRFSPFTCTVLDKKNANGDKMCMIDIEKGFCKDLKSTNGEYTIKQAFEMKKKRAGWSHIRGKVFVADNSFACDDMDEDASVPMTMTTCEIVHNEKYKKAVAVPDKNLVDVIDGVEVANVEDDDEITKPKKVRNMRKSGKRNLYV